MMKNIYLGGILFIFCLIFSPKILAQPMQKGDLVDGIAAVIGDEIILESEVLEQMNYAQQQGAASMTKCEFMESLVNNKVLIYQAKKDTLIENQSAAIKEGAEKKYNQFLSQFPDEKTMLAAYKFRTPYEMRNAMEKIDSDQYYMGEKYRRITEKVDVTPAEVTDFYNQYQTQFPPIKDEVTLARISIYPELTEAHKEDLINRLKKIKQDIENGESFESQARIYSEDPGSAATGGLMKNISKGQMVKPFEAGALNLQEGEISEPIETEFGYHIIRLERRAGKIYDASHILLMAVPTDEEIATAKKKMDSIKTLILTEKLTFKEAAYKFSDDKSTKFNAGIIPGRDGSSRIEKETLDPNLAYEVTGLNKGDMTSVFENELNRRKAVTLVRVEDVIPAHQISLESDYDRIKSFALDNKKRGKLDNWVKEQIPDIFISIDNRYNTCDFSSKWNKELIKQ